MKALRIFRDLQNWGFWTYDKIYVNLKFFQLFEDHGREVFESYLSEKLR